MLEQLTFAVGKQTGEISGRLRGHIEGDKKGDGAFREAASKGFQVDHHPLSGVVDEQPATGRSFF